MTRPTRNEMSDSGQSAGNTSGAINPAAARPAGTPHDAPATAGSPIDSGWRPGMPDRRVIPDRREFRSPTTGIHYGESGPTSPQPAAPTAPAESVAPASSTSHDTGLERRRGPGRRRSDFMRSAEEGEMTQEQFLFLMAIDAFKRVNGKTFPTWTDVLEIVRRLGYRKVQRSELNLPQAEDWLERVDAPARVNRPGQAESMEGPRDEDEDDNGDGTECAADAAAISPDRAATRRRRAA